MNHSSIQILYFITLFFYTAVEITLLFLNARSAKEEKSELPQSIKNLQTDTIRENTVAYTLAKTRLQILHTLYSSLLLFLLISASAFGLFDSYLREHFDSLYLRGCLFIFGISFFFSLLHIPFSLYSTFVVEEKFGFNKTTAGLWLVDLLKGTLLSLLISTPLLVAALYFMEYFHDFWWLYLFLLFAGFQIVMMLVYPRWIAPLFNKFEPLQDDSLAKEIHSLADALSFETQGIFQMDASKRSSHGNAYFAGFGKTRRIVLFDTLIQKLSPAQLCAVLAHEIGHAKKRHILKSVILSMACMLAGLYIASLLLHSKDFFRAFGIEEPSSYALLLLFSIAFEPVLFFLTPLTSVFSRRNEYEADRFAVDAMKGHTDLEDALSKLSTESLSNLSPHPWYSFFHYSHPSLPERIRAMEEYATKKNITTA
jgi:STE24 endopeptidase